MIPPTAAIIAIMLPDKPEDPEPPTQKDSCLVS